MYQTQSYENSQILSNIKLFNSIRRQALLTYDYDLDNVNKCVASFTVKSLNISIDTFEIPTV